MVLEEIFFQGYRFLVLLGTTFGRDVRGKTRNLFPWKKISLVLIGSFEC